jgi:hypothetical protein
MDQSEDPWELERKIERANRIASRVTDQTTSELLGAWVEELRQKLRQLLDARRTKHEIKACCARLSGSRPEILTIPEIHRSREHVWLALLGNRCQRAETALHRPPIRRKPDKRIALRCRSFPSP